jgi:dual specificity tyrosine-phosphorylation-regulated kinase 2/3/4
MATPEYMAPEILNFILYENEFEYIPKLLEYVQKYTNPWVIDVWSLGSVLLEIVSGVPLWMSLKTIVRKKNAEVIRYGLFAIKGRAFDKIIKQQLEVVQNLEHYLYE